MTVICYSANVYNGKFRKLHYRLTLIRIRIYFTMQCRFNNKRGRSLYEIGQKIFFK